MLIDRDGDPDFVKVLDFGVVKRRNLAKHPSLTEHGWVGTPAFLVITSYSIHYTKLYDCRPFAERNTC